MLYDSFISQSKEKEPGNPKIEPGKISHANYLSISALRSFSAFTDNRPYTQYTSKRGKENGQKRRKGRRVYNKSVPHKPPSVNAANGEKKDNMREKITSHPGGPQEAGPDQGLAGGHLGPFGALRSFTAFTDNSPYTQYTSKRGKGNGQKR